MSRDQRRPGDPEHTRGSVASRSQATSRLLPGILVVALVLAPGSSVAQNILPNPGFDSDLEGWSRSAFIGVWSPEDADNSPESGSASYEHVTAPSGGAFLTTQCLTIIGGATYDVGAHFLVPTGQGDGRISLDLRTYEEPNCQGASNSVTMIRLRDEDSFGTWMRVEDTHTPPPGAVSGSVSLSMGNHEEGAFEVFADNLELCLEGTCEEGGGPTTSCIPDETTACLLSGRFAVTVAWTTAAGDSGPGSVMEFNSQRAESDESAFFWFFNASNFEAGVKMVDACIPGFDRFWVFANGLTDQGYLIEITDTITGSRRAYGNPVGELPRAVRDLDAFLCD